MHNIQILTPLKLQQKLDQAVWWLDKLEICLGTLERQKLFECLKGISHLIYPSLTLNNIFLVAKQL